MFSAIRSAVIARAPLGFRMYTMSSAMLARSVGTVKWFDPIKGFGFITGKGDESDIFVHQSAIHSSGFRALTVGETVEYDVESQKDGRRKAANVTGPGGADILPPARSPTGQQW